MSDREEKGVDAATWRRMLIKNGSIRPAAGRGADGAPPATDTAAILGVAVLRLRGCVEERRVHERAMAEGPRDRRWPRGDR